jgi:Flp pilus assembly protein TadG
MCSWLNRLRRCRRGVAAVEFGLMLPMLMILLVCIVELGRFLALGEAVEKGLRAGAMYAARQDLPLSASTQNQIRNLVRTGTNDGSGAYLAPALGDPAVTVAINPKSETTAGSTFTVIELTASVPYDELLPGMLNFFGLSQLSVTMSHEQVHIGA